MTAAALQQVDDGSMTRSVSGAPTSNPMTVRCVVRCADFVILNKSDMLAKAGHDGEPQGHRHRPQPPCRGAGALS